MAHELRDLEAARLLHAESLALRRALGTAGALLRLARTRLGQGDVSGARAGFVEALQRSPRLRCRVGFVECLEGLAGVSLAEERLVEAARRSGLWAAAAGGRDLLQ